MLSLTGRQNISNFNEEIQIEKNQTKKKCSSIEFSRKKFHRIQLSAHCSQFVRVHAEFWILSSNEILIIERLILTVIQNLPFSNNFSHFSWNGILMLTITSLLKIHPTEFIVVQCIVHIICILWILLKVLSEQCKILLLYLFFSFCVFFFSFSFFFLLHFCTYSLRNIFFSFFSFYFWSVSNETSAEF